MPVCRSQWYAAGMWYVGMLQAGKVKSIAPVKIAAGKNEEVKKIIKGEKWTAGREIIKR